MDPNLSKNPGYSLSVLEEEWSKYVAESEHNWPEVSSSGGLIAQAYSLFKLDFDYELADSVSEVIRQVSTDWNFLDMLDQSTWNWSPIDERLQQPSIISSLLKIHPCGCEIDRCIEACDFGKMYIFNRSKKLLALLGECQRTIAMLTEEILGALEHISSLKLRVNPPSESFWGNFIGCVLENLQSIMSGDGGGYDDKQISILYDELQLIQRFLSGVGGCIIRSRFVANHAFVTHIVSVVVRIANQSCYFWFNRKDGNIARVKALGLVNLQHQIDPANPKFMKLIIRFQEVLYDHESKNPSYFVGYILNSCRNKDIDKKLMSLVTLFFTTTLRSHSHREDVHCLFAEIEVYLAEAAILHHTTQKNKTDHLHSCKYLLYKICMLKTEFYLKEQLSTITSSMPFSDNQILKVEKTLNNLRRVTAYLCRRRGAEYGEQDSFLTQELDGEVQSLYKSLQSKKMTESMIKHLLLQLPFKIVFFKAESFLSELSKSVTGKYQIESFIMELKYLKRVVSNQLVRNLRDEEILLFMQVEAVARRVSLLSYSILPDNDKFAQVVTLLPELLIKVKDIKGKLEVVSSLIPPCSFPKTFELGFIDFLARNIRDVLKYSPESVRPLDNMLEQAQSYLYAFKSVLIKVSDSDIQKGELNSICIHFMELAYKLEYVVESIEVDGHLEHSLWLYDLLEDIRLVNEQVSRISETSTAVDLDFPSASGVSFKRVSKDTTPAINQMNVDLVDERRAVINLLMRGSSQRDVVSIVGMPGIGKTTLAEKVYNDKNVICHFSRRAWCNVSQVYSRRDLLLDLLSSVHGNLDKFHVMSDEDLLSKLRRCLLGSRYLIVMDDVWDTTAWDDMQISFPKDSNGSRILITSRLQDVHSTINPGSDPHFIRSFSVEESWMLLKKKIFEGVVCPSELLPFGKKIAKDCQGLPLAVVAVAGLLQKTEKTQYWWRKISSSISSQLMADPSPENRCKEILEISYKHLPEYLKACFLYMGVFLRDKEIPVRKLTQLWLAEGFLQENESKSLEVVAHDYLMELIKRSLVIISKTRSDGEVKTCRLHDLLRDLCHLKARDENFLHLVTGDDEPYASFPDSDYDMQFHRHKLDPVIFESYRLSINMRRNHFIDSKPSGPRTRSLLFFASVADKELRCPYEISLILTNFKLLRVLDLECINMGVSFPSEIGLMVQLRYLALSGYMQSIPPSIANLWKLQTLVVRGFRGTVMLPATIWGMASLRHLHVNEHVSFSEDHEHGGSSFCLENLVSFCTPALSFGDKTINILTRFPNLLKMRCIFLESWGSSKSCNEFPVLDFLSQLEALKIIYHGRAVNSGEFILPLNLKKLTLSNFRLPWKHISKIGGLRNLKVLKLLSGAFNGPKWEMKEDEFLELEFLKLDALSIAEWIACDDHLPSLKRLVLQNCKDLKEVPQEFAYISTLEVVEVHWCTKALEESAERIRDLAEEIKVVIA